MRRKDDNGCTEVRNREEDPAFMYKEKNRPILRNKREKGETQAVELTTFRTGASSGKRN